MTTSFAPGTPSWVDLGTTDVPAAARFYAALFDWELAELGPEAGGYGMLRRDGKLVAGIGPATDPDRGTSWSVYFATPDVDATTARVEAHGGKVIAPPMDVMDQGRMAVFQDPTGVFFSIWQAGGHAGAELVDAPGSMSWIELMSPDMSAAKSFYEAALGLTIRDVDLGPAGEYTIFEVGGRTVAGGMTAPVGPDGDSVTRWSVYFAVEDTDVVADRALDLGATEQLRQNSPAGRFAFLVDPQGGGFCVIRPNPDFSM